MTRPPAFATVTEADFMRQVCELAEILGFEWVHFRAGMNRRGIWETPFRGPLGKGFPDLLLIRARDQRHLAVELKAKGNKPTPEQLHVLSRFEAAGFETFVWWPADFDVLAVVLR